MTDVVKPGEMKGAALHLLRLWISMSIAKDKRPHEVLLGVASMAHKIEQDLMLEHDIPGVRYWYHAESDSHFSTRPYEDLGTGFDAGLCVEITRAEYLEEMSL